MSTAVVAGVLPAGGALIALRRKPWQSIRRSRQAEGEMTELGPHAAPLVVIGPSGSGKSTLIQALLKHRMEFELVPTWTTRPRRPREPAGHVFVDEQTFNSHSFLGTVAVFGERYGLPEFTCRSRPLLLLRVFVLDQLFPLFPDARVVQVEAPFDLLARRLRQRGSTERIDEQVLIAEVESGRRFAHAVVVSDGSFSENLRRFEEAIDSVG